MTQNQVKLYLTLVLLSVASWLLSYLFEEKIVDESVTIYRSPSYFSLGYHKNEMDDKGLLKSELVAEKMYHYSDDGTTHLDKPMMTLINANTKIPPWVIVSDKGVLQADNDHLWLEGNVVISRKAHWKREAFKITTSDLNVILSVSSAATAKWAELMDGSNRTRGIGLEATYIDPVKIKFLSAVKGKYEFK